MAITNTKTWEYAVNISEGVGSGLLDRNQRLWLRLKEALTDTGSLSLLDEDGASLANLTSPFVVVASSDSSTADASDNWSSSTDVVADDPGSPHSWIHLRQTDYFGSGDHLHLLLDVTPSGVSAAAGRVAWARGATGYNNDGTVNNAPTLNGSAIELAVRSGSSMSGDNKSSDAMWGTDASNAPAVLHLRMSDDGKCGGWFVCRAGEAVQWFGWQEDEDGDPSRTNPFWAWASGNDSGGDQPTWAETINSLSIFRTWDNAGTELNGFLSQACFGASEDLITEFNTSPSRMLSLGYLMHSASTLAASVLTDMWWGSALDSTGDQSPSTPPVVRTQFGHMVVPWPSGESVLVS